MTTTDTYEMTEEEAGRNNKRGRLLQRVIIGVFLAIGVYVAVKSLDLPYYTRVGPGPAFFPFWLGVVIAALSALALLVSFKSKPEIFEDRIVPQRSASLEMLVTFGMIAFFALTIQPLGFVFSIFIVLIVLLLINRVQWLTALLVALGGSVGVGYAFSAWLRVYVPVAPNGLLSALGL
jgi:putative tricarboxylic transport membrane protein